MRCEHKVKTLVPKPGAEPRMLASGHWATPQYQRVRRCPNQAIHIWHRDGEGYEHPDTHWCADHLPRENRLGHLQGYKGSWFETV